MTMSRLITLVVCLLGGLLGGVPAGAQAPSPALSAAATGDVAMVLPLHALPAVHAQALRAEATAIWARAGVALTWHRTPVGLDGVRTVVVYVQAQLPPSRTSARGPLGVVMKEGDGFLPAIFVSRAAVRRLVAKAGVARDAVGFDPLFGRMLGRAVAHELGHLLLGEGHGEDGLMRAGYAPDEVVREGAEALYQLTVDERTRLGLGSPSLIVSRRASR
jgi:hypothetical protein